MAALHRGQQPRKRAQLGPECILQITRSKAWRKEGGELSGNEVSDDNGRGGTCTEKFREEPSLGVEYMRSCGDV